MADLSKLNVPIGGTATTYNLKDKAVRDTLIEAQTSNKGKVWKTDATTGIPSWQSESGGTTVVPNPSGTASIELSKIGIDGTNYNIKDTTYSDATTSASGLMSASDKTKLNGIATGAEVNVQSDWTQTTTTADDYIKNKPNLATVATSGSYNDLSNKPTIPTVPSAYTSNPAMNGTASAGSSGSWSRGDHVHPTDTSRAAASTAYSTSDTAETTLADDDKVPFYDTSASGKRSSTWANIKAKLKSYFDTLYTGNTGTVTSVATGVGLTGGAITSSGTIKAKLQSETQSSLTAATRGETSGREYPVGVDASGNLSVNVPWSSPFSRCWVYSESTSTEYFKIYDSSDTTNEMTSLWVCGTIGHSGNAGHSYPFTIAINLRFRSIDGFFTSGYDSLIGDIILTSDGTARRVYIALISNLTAADVYIRSPFGGGTNTSPPSTTTYQGSIDARMSDLAKLPTKPLEQSVTLSTSSTTSVTFSNNKITSDSIIEYFCSEWGLVPDDISVSSDNKCTVTMPKVESSKTVNVGIFVR